ncbi:MAG: hypothetical protein ACLFV7_03980 [Phycisphaerae bacterium]
MSLSDEYDHTADGESADHAGEEMEWREDEFRFQPDPSTDEDPSALIPLAEDEHDASGEIELLGAPPREDAADSQGGFVADVMPRRPSHNPWPARLLALAILGGLAYGAHAGWTQLKTAWGEFTGNVQYIHAKGEDSPDRKKLVKGRLDHNGRDTKARSADGSEKTDEDDQPWTGKVIGARSRKGSSAGPSREARPNTLSKDGYTLSAIVAGPDGRVAMINGRCVRKGARIDGATVSQITDDSVTLSRGGESIVLKW